MAGGGEMTTYVRPASCCPSGLAANGAGKNEVVQSISTNVTNGNSFPQASR